MNYDPLDPKNVAFYLTFVDDEPERPPPLPGCFGCFGVVVLAIVLMVIAGALLH